jgi:micrococcal nuclease
MTKQQIAILAGLGLAVLCVLCSGIYIVVSEERAYRALQGLTPSIPQPAADTPAPTDTPVSPTPGRVQAQVVRVVDGDTIEVDMGGHIYAVRYIGIDTPETQHPDKPVEPFGPEASAKNEELVGGKVVELEKDVSETDRYDRLLRYVWVGDLMVNAELVRLGYAQVSTYPPDVKYQELFLQLQQEARDAGAGLWGQPEPTEVAAPPLPPGTAEVVIQYILYDGAVPSVESDEYAEIANDGPAPVDLGGWLLNAGATGQDFVFPGFVLQPGQVCRVYTNEHHADSCGFSFGSSKPLWNNKGDCGYLYNASRELVSTYCY